MSLSKESALRWLSNGTLLIDTYDRDPSQFFIRSQIVGRKNVQLLCDLSEACVEAADLLCRTESKPAEGTSVMDAAKRLADKAAEFLAADEP